MVAIEFEFPVLKLEVHIVAQLGTTPTEIAAAIVRSAALQRDRKAAVCVRTGETTGIAAAAVELSSARRTRVQVGPDVRRHATIRLLSDVACGP